MCAFKVKVNGSNFVPDNHHKPKSGKGRPSDHDMSEMMGKIKVLPQYTNAAMAKSNKPKGAWPYGDDMWNDAGQAGRVEAAHNSGASTKNLFTTVKTGKYKGQKSAKAFHQLDSGEDRQKIVKYFGDIRDKKTGRKSVF